MYKEYQCCLGWELIDTLWNVNYKAYLERTEKAKGINRYIMECKYVTIDGQQYIADYELIDTLWNVNPFLISEDFHLW